MYVCNCTGVTEREVRALAGAVAAPDQVHAHYGRTPRCRRCLVDIAAMLDLAHQAEACIGRGERE